MVFFLFRLSAGINVTDFSTCLYEWYRQLCLKHKIMHTMVWLYATKLRDIRMCSFSDTEIDSGGLLSPLTDTVNGKTTLCMWY